MTAPKPIPFLYSSDDQKRWAEEVLEIPTGLTEGELRAHLLGKLADMEFNPHPVAAEALDILMGETVAQQGRKPGPAFQSECEEKLREAIDEFNANYFLMCPRMRHEQWIRLRDLAAPFLPLRYRVWTLRQALHLVDFPAQEESAGVGELVRAARDIYSAKPDERAALRREFLARRVYSHSQDFATSAKILKSRYPAWAKLDEPLIQQAEEFHSKSKRYKWRIAQMEKAKEKRPRSPEAQEKVNERWGIGFLKVLLMVGIVIGINKVSFRPGSRTENDSPKISPKSPFSGERPPLLSRDEQEILRRIMERLKADPRSNDPAVKEFDNSPHESRPISSLLHVREALAEHTSTFLPTRSNCLRIFRLLTDPETFPDSSLSTFLNSLSDSQLLTLRGILLADYHDAATSSLVNSSRLGGDVAALIQLRQLKMPSPSIPPQFAVESWPLPWDQKSRSRPQNAIRLQRNPGMIDETIEAPRPPEYYSKESS